MCSKLKLIMLVEISNFKQKQVKLKGKLCYHSLTQTMSLYSLDVLEVTDSVRDEGTVH